MVIAMSTAAVTFHGALNDFLASRRQRSAAGFSFEGRPSVKDVIESLGVPHTEVDVIVVNGVSVDFMYLVQDGDRIDVYPFFSLPDVRPLVHLRPALAGEARFVLDQHLGKLAMYLRLLGFDTLYRNDYHDAELAQVSSAQQRILLTRDRGLLKRGMVDYGYFVRETEPRPQVVEIVRRYELAGSITPFRRCLRCNGLLEQVAKDEIAGQLAAKTREFYDDFRRCTACGQIYWRGSHYDRLRQFIDQVLFDSQTDFATRPD